MDIYPSLIERYWTGQCTDEERVQVEEWLRSGEPENKYSIPANTEKDQLKLELWSKISESTGITYEAGLKKKKKVIPVWVLYTAASLLVLLGTVFLNGRLTHRNQITMQEVKVPLGRQAKLTLKDGTLIILNAGSTLNYPETFQDERKVQLSGEGYFEVAKNRKMPFIIETRSCITRVLGTKFNLREFTTDNQTKITLVEGSVAFSKKNGLNAITLSPDHQATLCKGEIVTKPVAIENYLDWKNGVLNFHEIQLSDALREIERYYDVTTTIRVTSLGNLKIKGRFKRMPVEKLMEEITYILNVRFKLKGRHITIY